MVMRNSRGRCWNTSCGCPEVLSSVVDAWLEASPAAACCHSAMGHLIFVPAAT